MNSDFQSLYPSTLFNLNSKKNEDVEESIEEEDLVEDLV